MTRRKTQEEYQKQVYAVFGDEYTVLDEYQNQKVKLLVRHNVCGTEYKAFPDNLIRGHGCAECFKRNKINRDKRLTPPEIEEYIAKFKNGEFRLLDHFFENGASKINVLHHLCGTESILTFQNFKKGNGCSRCGEVQRRKSKTKLNERFHKEITAVFGDEYTLMTPYQKAKEYITVRHNTCGHIYQVRAIGLLKGRRCPQCAHRSRSEKKSMSNDDFLRKFSRKWGVEYLPLEEYTRSQIKIKVRHVSCGNEYMVMPNLFLRGTGCPRCCMIDSKACKRIEAFLESHGFPYIREFKIDECRHQKVLPFDFAIMHNNEIKLLIEFDGEQHFVPIKHFGGEKELAIRRKRDAIKNEYCANHGIRLLRIHYSKEDQIEELLTKELL